MCRNEAGGSVCHFFNGSQNFSTSPPPLSSPSLGQPIFSYSQNTCYLPLSSSSSLPHHPEPKIRTIVHSFGGQEKPLLPLSSHVLCSSSQPLLLNDSSLMHQNKKEYIFKFLNPSSCRHPQSPSCIVFWLEGEPTIAYDYFVASYRLPDEVYRMTRKQRNKVMKHSQT